MGMSVWRAVLALLLVGVGIGLGLGFLIGWGVWPVEYYDTDPVDLRAEHKEEYIVLVSAAYALNGDLDHAKDRLAKLEEEDIAQVVGELAEKYLERGEDSTTTTNLVMLADALGSSTEAMLAYVATPTLAPTFTPTATEVPSSTPTDTPLPTETATAVPPTATATPVPPTATSTSVPPTSTPQPPTSTSVPATATSTSVPATSTSQPVAATATPSPTTQSGTGCPARPEPVILDIDRNARNWRWVENHFGLSREYLWAQAPSCPGGTVYSIVKLAQYTDVTLRVTVLDGNGVPKPGVQVAFFGFEPYVETLGGCCGRKSVAHMETTNERGEATYVMGPDSAYWPEEGQQGYHAVWVADGNASDCADGLGWVGLTFHDHLNVTFRQIS
jgi:hypothetical protein